MEAVISWGSMLVIGGVVGAMVRRWRRKEPCHPSTRILENSWVIMAIKQSGKPLERRYGR